MKKTGRSKNFESKKSVKLRKMEKIAEEEQDEEHEQDFKDVEARAAWARAKKMLLTATFGFGTNATYPHLWLDSYLSI